MTVIALVIVPDVFQNVFDIAVKYSAQIVQGHRADGLVVLEPVQKTAAYAVGVDQLVGRNALGFHCFIKRFIGNHISNLSDMQLKQPLYY